jgi:hypothetical protein
MKQPKEGVPDDDMRPEYDFTGGVRGKYYERYRSSSNIVVLDPDVSEAFPNSAAVNAALRMLVSVARKRVSTKRPHMRKRRPNNEMQLTRSAKPRRRGPRS